MIPLTHSDFLQQVVLAFPDVADELASFANYPSLQARRVGTRLQRAKGAADWDAYGRGVRLLEDAWSRADAQLERELQWSLLKALDFDGPRGLHAWELLSPELQHAWRVTRRKLDSLNALPAPRSRPKRRQR